ncbi:pirin family protein [Mycobacterium xenopi 3993]|nr:pirin family protein [Mycobacterium xenopi 3993]
MEILTWVLQGSLAHRDSAGNRGVIYPGLAQRMSAGSGILHSEKNDSPTEPVRFVQMWVLPDETGIAPGYQQHEIDDQLLTASLTTIASGIPRHDAAITIHNRNAALHGARLRPSNGVDLPAARTCTCSLHAAKSWSRASASLTRATQSASQHPTASGSPPPGRQKSWSGRCTPNLAASAAVSANTSPRGIR